MNTYTQNKIAELEVLKAAREMALEHERSLEGYIAHLNTNVTANELRAYAKEKGIEVAGKPVVKKTSKSSIIEVMIDLHCKEMGYYTKKDLEGFELQIEEMENETMNETTNETMNETTNETTIKELSTFVVEEWLENLNNKYGQPDAPEVHEEVQVEVQVEVQEAETTAPESDEVEVEENNTGEATPEIEASKSDQEEEIEGMVTVTQVGRKCIPAGYTYYVTSINVEVYFHGKMFANPGTELGAKRAIYKHVGALKLPSGYTIEIENKKHMPYQDGAKIATCTGYSTLEEAENFIFRKFKKETGADFPVESVVQH